MTNPYPPPKPTAPPLWGESVPMVPGPTGDGQRNPDPSSMPGAWWNTGTPPPAAPEPRLVVPRPNYWLHGGLFLASVISTLFVYSIIGHVPLRMGAYYSAGIMGILLAHEMGHYLTARHYRVPASLPYFIPMPFSIFGTMGAVIRMASLGADRKTLFDIGVAGPIAGLVLALPACLLGLRMSQIVPSVGRGELGSSLLFQWMQDLVFGKIPPGHDVLLHPLAFAGWAGLFVTALNLLPIGQLDGGHVVYALLGPRARWLSLAVTLGFGLMAVFVSPSWFLMAILLMMFGLRHPPTADDSRPMDNGRRVLGVILMIFFVLSFTPDPFPS